MPSSFRVEADADVPDRAPPGTVWLCGDCGLTWRLKSEATCRSIVLVHEASLRYEDGVLVIAEAVNDPEAEIPW